MQALGSRIGHLLRLGPAFYPQDLSPLAVALLLEMMAPPCKRLYLANRLPPTHSLTSVMWFSTNALCYMNNSLFLAKWQEVLAKFSRTTLVTLIIFTGMLTFPWLYIQWLFKLEVTWAENDYYWHGKKLLYALWRSKAFIFQDQKCHCMFHPPKNETKYYI